MTHYKFPPMQKKMFLISQSIGPTFGLGSYVMLIMCTYYYMDDGWDINSHLSINSIHYENYNGNLILELFNGWASDSCLMLIVHDDDTSFPQIIHSQGLS